MTTSIDLAFIDRADIKQYIGYCTAEAIYEIFSLACNELGKCDLIQPNNFKFLSIADIAENKSGVARSAALHEIAKKSIGLSGRLLKKIPFLAFALFVKSETVTIDEYLLALEAAVGKCLDDNAKMKE